MSEDPDLSLLAPGGLGTRPADLDTAATASVSGVGNQPGVGVAGSFKLLGCHETSCCTGILYLHKP